MGLDIRLPIGVLFSFLGLILTTFGPLSPSGIYTRSLGLNVSLIWGVVLLVFGAAMTALALKAEKARHGQTGAGLPPGRGNGRPE